MGDVGSWPNKRCGETDHLEHDQHPVSLTSNSTARPIIYFNTQYLHLTYLGSTHISPLPSIWTIFVQLVSVDFLVYFMLPRVPVYNFLRPFSVLCHLRLLIMSTPWLSLGFRFSSDLFFTSEISCNLRPKKYHKSGPNVIQPSFILLFNSVVKDPVISIICPRYTYWSVFL